MYEENFAKGKTTSAVEEFTANVIDKVASWSPEEQLRFVERVKKVTVERFLILAKEHQEIASRMEDYAQELRSV